MAVMAMTLFGGESVFSQTLHSAHSMINTGEATVASRADDGESADDKKPGEVPEEIVNGGWKSIGEGMWFEDLFTTFSDYTEFIGMNWKVNIEQSELYSGYYRMIPYYEGTYMAEVQWGSDSTYFYVDARNPEQVVAKDFVAYGDFMFSHVVPENGWGGSNGYGTLVDGVISFPKSSIYVNFYGDWMESTPIDGLKIALPGANIADYSITYALDFCQSSANVEFTLRLGVDGVRTVGGVYKGYYQNTEANISSIAANAKELTAGEQSFTLDDGVYTFFAVMLDNDNNIVSSKVSNFFVYDDDKSQWTDIGTTDYCDDIYSSIYPSIPFNQSHKVIVEQNKNNSGLYRLKNPYFTAWEHYNTLSLNLDLHYHSHYIVIDVTNPDKVVMKSSNLGINATFAGYGVVESVPSFNESIGQPAGDLYGTFKDGVISFPVNGLVFYEHADGRAYVANRNGRMKFAIPGTSAIDGVEVSGEEASATYYNLSGMPVAHPVKGGMYIKRTADKAEKVIF